MLCKWAFIEFIINILSLVFTTATCYYQAFDGGIHFRDTGILIRLLRLNSIRFWVILTSSLWAGRNAIVKPSLTSYFNWRDSQCPILHRNQHKFSFCCLECLEWSPMVVFQGMTPEASLTKLKPFFESRLLPISDENLTLPLSWTLNHLWESMPQRASLEAGPLYDVLRICQKAESLLHCNLETYTDSRAFSSSGRFSPFTDLIRTISIQFIAKSLKINPISIIKCFK